MEEMPVYMRIARDIARRIAEGELAEGSLISGRSLLGSAYGVSPETARRAMSLLDDMGIVRTEQKVGSRVVSRKRALEYMEQHQSMDELRTLRRELEKLREERAQVDARMLAVVDRMTTLATHFADSGTLRTYEFLIGEGSRIAGQTIGALAFREQTGATIVAVRRGDDLITSPGPALLLLPQDTIIAVCDITGVEKVRGFIG